MSAKKAFRRLVRDVWLNGIVSSYLVPPILRPLGLRMAGISVGRGVKMYARQLFTGTRLSIGDNSFVNYGCLFDAYAAIIIGQDVLIGQQVTFVTSSHEVTEFGAGDLVVGEIHVGDGAWIGARSVLLPGVSIGQGTIIAAGSVVTADCDPHCVYAGVPAKLKRKLTSAPRD